MGRAHLLCQICISSPSSVLFGGYPAYLFCHSLHSSLFVTPYVLPYPRSGCHSYCLVLNTHATLVAFGKIKSHHFLYLDLPGNAIYEDMQYPIVPGLTSPGRLGAWAPELSDIAYPHKLHFPVDPSMSSGVFNATKSCLVVATIKSR